MQRLLNNPFQSLFYRRRSSSNWLRIMKLRHFLLSFSISKMPLTFDLKGGSCVFFYFMLSILCQTDETKISSLFHVTHTRDYQPWMPHRTDACREFNNGFKKAGAANDSKILATSNNRGWNTRIWILKANVLHALEQALESILKFGTYNIIPVSAM